MDKISENKLFTDAGVALKNPSTIGGMWAYRLLQDGLVVAQASGFIEAKHFPGAVTNNQTEMLALVRGLEALPPDWVGTIYSDSQITLGRAFLGWKWDNIPTWLYNRFGQQRARLENWWPTIQYVLLDGHPTRAQLKAGIGKRGHPVDVNNKWCDEACTQAAQDYLNAEEADRMWREGILVDQE